MDGGITISPVIFHFLKGSMYCFLGDKNDQLLLCKAPMCFLCPLTFPSTSRLATCHTFAANFFSPRPHFSPLLFLILFPFFFLLWHSLLPSTSTRLMSRRRRSPPSPCCLTAPFCLYVQWVYGGGAVHRELFSEKNNNF